MNRRRLLLATLIACATAAHADDAFPNKPIRLIVPVAAGGSADLLGRLIGQQLSTLYKQPVVVENRPGASGHIGAEHVAKSAPDGYTLLLGIPPVQAGYSIYPKLAYDPTKQLDTLSVIGTFPSLLIVNSSVPVKDVQGFIKLAKESPGMITFGSAGPGSVTHMGGELFMQEAGVKLAHVPYKGSSAASADLIGGHIQAMFENLPTAVSLIKGGRVKALGVTGHKRSASLPDLPSVAEQGVPTYNFVGWYTIVAPVGMPADIARKLSADIHKIVHSPSLAARWQELGVTPVGGTIADNNAFVRSEADKYGKLIKAANLSL